MKNTLKQQECVVCGSNQLSSVINIEDIPTHCNLLFDSLDEAIKVPRGMMDLVYCQRCGHFFNSTFDPAVMEYAGRYENSLHFSPYFKKYAETLALEMIDKYDLRYKKIIDIGCGRGDFLKLLCELGDNFGCGFDRSYVPDENDAKKYKKIKFIQDFYSDRYSDINTDFILCRHVLEHIQYPKFFLKEIRKAIKSHSEIVLFFEVPNALYTIKNLGIWDLIYEHCSYFTLNSLSQIFSESGFNVTNVREKFQGQFLTIEATVGELSKMDLPAVELKVLAGYAKEFSKAYMNKIKILDKKIKKLLADQKTVVVWGAGSKGVTLLNVLKMKDLIKYVVDINPRKEGKYVAGTGQQIVSPNFLKDLQPDAIIVMNKVYTREIKKMVTNAELNPDFLFA